jgi:hypothetical protein
MWLAGQAAERQRNDHLPAGHQYAEAGLVSLYARATCLRISPNTARASPASVLASVTAT